MTWLSSYDSSFECDGPQTLVKGGLGAATYPGPLKEEEKGPGTHCMRMRRGTPPGNDARLGAAGSTMVLQQWCAITLSSGVLSLHTQQSVHFRRFSIATSL